MASRKEEVVLFVTCMDWRFDWLRKLASDSEMALEQKLKIAAQYAAPGTKEYDQAAEVLEETDGKKVVLAANAGAVLTGMRDTLAEIFRKYEVTRFIICTHKVDCGGVRDAVGCVIGKVPLSDPKWAYYGLSMMHREIEAGKDPHAVNFELQKRGAITFMGGDKPSERKVTAIMMDLTRIAQPQENLHLGVVQEPGQTIPDTDRRLLYRAVQSKDDPQRELTGQIAASIHVSMSQLGAEPRRKPLPVAH